MDQAPIRMSESLTAAIKKRAREFVDANLARPTALEYLSVENAMLIGAELMGRDILQSMRENQ